MTHTYTINGATCGGCLKTIKEILSKLPEIQSLEATLEPPVATIKLSKHVSLDYLNQALIDAGKGKYSLSNEQMLHDSQTSKNTEDSYKFSDFVPLIVVFGYILAGSFVLTNFFGLNTDRLMTDSSHTMGNAAINFMNYLMGLWFLIFAMFKLFDLKGFAEGYSMYDLIAKKWFGWGFVYPFVEIALGLAYLLNFQMFWTNIITLVVMTIGAVGIGIKLSKKEKFQCACLGTIFKIPLTQISLYEDIAMAVMALGMMFLR